MNRYRILSLALSAILTGFCLFNVAIAGAAPVPSSYEATSSALQSDACGGLTELDSGETCDKSGTEVTTTIGKIVNLLGILIGAIAIIMVLVSGLRYVTSGGEPEKVSGAKRALMYALIGLVIAASAELLVHFVLYQSNIILPSK